MSEAPWDQDAETAVLGALLLPMPHADKLRVLDQVDPDDFWKPEHRQVAGALAALVGEGATVDAVTVGARLGWTDRQRLLELQAATPGTHGVVAHAKVVADLARCRRAIELGERMQRLGYDRDLTGLLAAVDGAPDRLRPALGHVESHDLDALARLADHDDDAPRKPWVMPGLLRTNEKVIVTGGEGVGKSTISRQWAVTTASGIHPLLGIPVGDDPLPALIVDLQEDEIDLAHALRPLRRRAGESYQPGMLHAVAWPAGVNLLARRDISRLEALIDQHKPKLVVMGPLVRLFRSEGNRSRHSEDLVDELTDNLDQLMVRYQFALVLEGHAGNERSTEEAWRPRGSSVWRSWPSVGIGLEGVSSKPREAKVHQWRWSRYADRAWPHRLVAGGGWPWGLDSGDYERLCRKLGLDWLIDGAEAEMTF